MHTSIHTYWCLSFHYSRQLTKHSDYRINIIERFRFLYVYVYDKRVTQLKG